jgi:hypothetical protein
VSRLTELKRAKRDKVPMRWGKLRSDGYHVKRWNKARGELRVESRFVLRTYHFQRVNGRWLCFGMEECRE